jgi:hypothetical protein
MADAERVLGSPIREVEPGKRYDYDPAGKGRRISIFYRSQDRIIEVIELEPGGLYTKEDYAEWFELSLATVAEPDNDGNWMELYLTQGVSLHFSGPTESDPVVFFRHFNRSAFVDEKQGEEVVAGSAETLVTTTESASDSPVDNADACQGIKGIWRWFNGAMVECFADGRCTATNGFNGEWNCLDPIGRFKISWSRPGQQVPYVDTLTLSSDGWELTGVSQAGHGVGGVRPTFAGGEPKESCEAIHGTWRWSGGAVVECLDDGTCTNSHGLSGRWRCINPSGRFEIRWSRAGRPNQFIDNLVISPLGSYLTGKNQFGVAVGAVRE